MQKQLSKQSKYNCMYVFVYMYLYVYICMYLCICIYVFVCVYLYVGIYVCMKQLSKQSKSRKVFVIVTKTKCAD